MKNETRPKWTFRIGGIKSPMKQNFNSFKIGKWIHLIGINLMFFKKNLLSKAHERLALFSYKHLYPRLCLMTLVDFEDLYYIFLVNRRVFNSSTAARSSELSFQYFPSKIFITIVVSTIRTHMTAFLNTLG